MKENEQMKKVSVVIPSYNRADAAIRCAKSAFASDYSNIEVIIVDDCSAKCDVAAEVMSAFGALPNLMVLRHDRNKRVAAARNTGARASTGEYIFFIDDDNILAVSTIRLLVNAIDSGRCAIAAPLAVNVSSDGAKTVWATSFEFSKWMSIPKNANANVFYDDEFAKNAAGKMFDSWYSPNGYMMRRETFDRLGGFVEWFGLYMEESDFCMRAMESGLGTCIVASAVTWHHHYNDTGDMALRHIATAPWRGYMLQRNRLVFALRHYRVVHVLSICLVFAPLLSVRYALTAVRHGYFAIALSFFTGYFAGLFHVLRGLFAKLLMFPLALVGMKSRCICGI